MKKWPVLQMAATAGSLWLPSPWPEHFLLSYRILFVVEVAMGPDSEIQFQVSLQWQVALTSAVDSPNEDSSYFSEGFKLVGRVPPFPPLFLLTREHRLVHWLSPCHSEVELRTRVMKQKNKGLWVPDAAKPTLLLEVRSYYTGRFITHKRHCRLIWRSWRFPGIQQQNISFNHIGKIVSNTWKCREQNTSF